MSAQPYRPGRTDVEAEQRALRERRDALRIGRIRTVMGTSDGREFVLELLTRCGWYEPFPTATNASVYVVAGKREATDDLYRTLYHDPRLRDLLEAMERERDARK